MMLKYRTTGGRLPGPGPALVGRFDPVDASAKHPTAVLALAEGLAEADAERAVGASGASLT